MSYVNWGHYVREVLTDGSEARGPEIKMALKKQGSKFGINLDELFNNTTEKVILGNKLEDAEKIIHENWKNLSESEKYEKQANFAEQGVVRIIQRILEKGINRPETVSIIKDYSFEHEPFSYRKGVESAKSGAKAFGKSQIAEDHYQHATDCIKKWLIKGGIPENIIQIVQNITYQNQSELVVPKSWFIVDRHGLENYKGVDKKDMYKTTGGGKIPLTEDIKVLVLPLSDFYRTARMQGLLDVDPQEFKQSLDEAFKKLFVEQEEEK